MLVSMDVVVIKLKPSDGLPVHLVRKKISHDKRQCLIFTTQLKNLLTFGGWGRGFSYGFEIL